MRRVYKTMGTVVSVDITGANGDVFKIVFAFLDYVNEQFGVINPSSQISRFNRNEIKRPGKDLQYLIAKSVTYQEQTNGYFSANFDGRFNPTGLVKGWAIKKVGELIESKGFREYMVNIGGDILAKGARTWRVGVQNPQERGQLIGVIKAKNMAVATSGTYERGNHIINPKKSSKATGVLSVTVTGPDIEAADVYATAICAMGPKIGFKFISAVPNYEALIIDKNLKSHPSQHLAVPKNV